MKLIAFIFVICMNLSLLAEEPAVNKFHVKGKVEVSNNCPAYPVLNLVSAFQSKNIERAKTFCTAEFLDHAKNRKQGGFNGYYNESFVTDYDASKPLKFRYYNPSKGKVKVLLAFNSKNSSATLKFYVKQVDGKWLITTK